MNVKRSESVLLLLLPGIDAYTCEHISAYWDYLPKYQITIKYAISICQMRKRVGTELWGENT